MDINGVTPASVEEATVLLNGFAGSFNAAEITPANLQESLGNALVNSFSPVFETEEI